MSSRCTCAAACPCDSARRAWLTSRCGASSARAPASGHALAVLARLWPPRGDVTSICPVAGTRACSFSVPVRYPAVQQRPLLAYPGKRMRPFDMLGRLVDVARQLSGCRTPAGQKRVAPVGKSTGAAGERSRPRSKGWCAAYVGRKRCRWEGSASAGWGPAACFRCRARYDPWLKSPLKPARGFRFAWASHKVWVRARSAVHGKSSSRGALFWLGHKPCNWFDTMLLHAPVISQKEQNPS